MPIKRHSHFMHAAGNISLPSTVLQFWDLGGQRGIHTVLSAPQILGVPLLLMANKQDNLNTLSVAEIRHDYEVWYQHKIESARWRQGSEMDNKQRRERIASLDVMGVSALEGTGVRAIVDWLFIRVDESS
ncbi:hypothetical protein BJV74DRAFT_846175 [Russula compacta]|nr:hypothetical protein BJV74DRAFT_846175 [Russula compacta]